MPMGKPSKELPALSCTWRTGFSVWGSRVYRVMSQYQAMNASSVDKIKRRAITVRIMPRSSPYRAKNAFLQHNASKTCTSTSPRPEARKAGPPPPSRKKAPSKPTETAANMPGLGLGRGSTSHHASSKLSGGQGTDSRLQRFVGFLG